MSEHEILNTKSIRNIIAARMTEATITTIAEL